MKKQLLLLCMLISAITLAQSTLIKDINLGNGGSFPGIKVAFKNEVYFVANDGIHGKELWKTNGTEAGTSLVIDINPGKEDGISVLRAFATASTLYFYAWDGTTNNALWKTDGTAAGTEKIKSFAGSIPVSEFSAAEINNELIFRVRINNDHKLYKTDGTESGTIQLKNDDPREIIKMGNDVYFSGDELYKTDGTVSGTVKVKDISPSGSSIPRDFKILQNNTLVFIANTTTYGNEFWKSDGTEAGTVLVKDIVAGGSGLATRADKVVLNDEIYFEQQGTLWKTDGTEAGTVEVQTGLGTVKNLFAVNNRVIVPAFNSSTQKQLIWTTDGTTANTSNFETNYTEFSHNNQSAIVGNNLFFQGTTASEGFELWKTDGTASGTVLVKDIHPQADDNNIEYLVGLNGNVIFSASDGNWKGKELYISDGTEAGTQLLKDINEEGNNSSSPQHFFQFGNKTLFSADNGEKGRELWMLENGNASLVKDINIGSLYSNPSNFIELNGAVYFKATTIDKGTELWKSDGTAAGTTLVKDIFADSQNGLIGRDIVLLNSKLYFYANDGVNGAELWESDGTEAGTIMVKDINTGDASSIRNGELYVFKNNIYFTAADSSNDYELWKSDGTEAGTNLFYDAHSSSSGSPQDFIEFKDGLHFRANSTSGLSMFRTDGSNTFRITNKGFSNMTVAGDYLYFQSTYSNGGELWATQNGVSVYQVKDIRPGSGGSKGSFPSLLTNHNGTLFFVANDGTNGNELWKSDGTNSGTTMVKNIGDGSDSVYITELISFDDKLVFGGGVSTSSQELWISDSTENGTKNLQEINPSTEKFNSGSRPQNFFISGNTLYFSADNGTIGSELYSLQESALSTESFVPEINKVIVYPNPFSSILNIKESNFEIKEVAVFNILGKLVFSKKANEIKSLDMSHFSKGVYLLKLSNEKTSITKKIIKQ